ncbi:MAG: glycosyltransferase family 2 protein [candidate division WOR-3 bacterium]
MKLSIVIPVYNEKDYIEKVIEMVENVKLNYPVEKEIVIVDDGSNDGTREILNRLKEEKKYLKIVFQEKNMGKGAALRKGFETCSGDIIVIQDADLEYDPNDWNEMLRLILEDKADIVYGSRFYGKPHRCLYFHHFLGNKLISFLINFLCDITLSDIEVCYKMFKREVLNSINLKQNDFGFEVEFTVKVAKQKRWRIYETAINYYGRTYKEGKKIKWKDGFKALWYIFKYRFFN